MAKIKYTKNELKRQKDLLKRFMRYLPMLVLKKQQLQTEIIKISSAIEEAEAEIDYIKQDVDRWVDVFGENVDIKAFVSVGAVKLDQGNIAGIDIPVFTGVEFIEKEYDLMATPIWVDFGIEHLKQIMAVKARLDVLDKQRELIQAELKVTTQRVNLFEKIKIPEATNNIKKIRTFLGDLETAGVVTGKIAKKKIESKEEREIFA